MADNLYSDYGGDANGGGAAPASSGPDTTGWDNQINGYYSNFLHRQASPDEVQYWITQGSQNPQGLSYVQNMIANSQEATNWAKNNSAAPASAPSGGVPNTIAPFSGVTYPGFTPPALPKSLQTPFQLPSANDLITNDPGYAARLKTGENTLQQGAAARGSLLNGGTQKALTNYGQDYASNEYGNYVNQLLGTRQQQASDYLNLTYGPAWQQNQSAVNQYNNLYTQYQDLIGNNRNAYNDYWQHQLALLGTGANAAGAGNPGVPAA